MMELINVVGNHMIELLKEIKNNIKIMIEIHIFRAPLANTLAIAEYPRYRLEQATGTIGFYVNANKIEF